MKIYVAGVFERHPELNKIARELTEMGHEVNARWLQAHTKQLPDDTDERQKVMAQFAYEDMLDVLSCDLMIQFTEDYSDSRLLIDFPNYGWYRGGRHSELGMALMRRMLFYRLVDDVEYARIIPCRIFMVGPREPQIFHQLPDGRVWYVWFDTWEDCKAQLLYEKLCIERHKTDDPNYVGYLDCLK